MDLRRAGDRSGRHCRLVVVAPAHAADRDGPGRSAGVSGGDGTARGECCGQRNPAPHRNAQRVRRSSRSQNRAGRSLRRARGALDVPPRRLSASVRGDGGHVARLPAEFGEEVGDGGGEVAGLAPARSSPRAITSLRAIPVDGRGRAPPISPRPTAAYPLLQQAYEDLAIQALPNDRVVAVIDILLATPAIDARPWCICRRSIHRCVLSDLGCSTSSTIRRSSR